MVSIWFPYYCPSSGTHFSDISVPFCASKKTCAGSPSSSCTAFFSPVGCVWKWEVYLGDSREWGTPKWMVYFMENPIRKRMMTRGTPILKKLPNGHSSKGKSWLARVFPDFSPTCSYKPCFIGKMRIRHMFLFIAFKGIPFTRQWTVVQSEKVMIRQDFGGFPQHVQTKSRCHGGLVPNLIRRGPVLPKSGRQGPGLGLHLEHPGGFLGGDLGVKHGEVRWNAEKWDKHRVECGFKMI